VVVERVDARQAREFEPSARPVDRALWSPTTATVDPAAIMRALAREAELPPLELLFRRASRNGVEVERLDPRQAREIEPGARPVGQALWSPTTATVDPGAIMAELVREVGKAGITMELGRAWAGRRADGIETTRGPLAARFVINCAGLQADRIAHAYGFGRRYRVLPFKGLYLVSGSPQPLRTSLYPVPDPAMPFLGVHLTRSTGGVVMIGPTALPALWREQYGGLQGFSPREFVQGAGDLLRLLLSRKSGLLRQARQELGHLTRRGLLRAAARLSEAVDPAAFTHRAPTGIRAQLVDLEALRLEMDFVVEGDGSSLHVLNAVSPAFTCAPSFAEYLADRVEVALS
ncbi:MAG: FAD-dependent oxidoreductase, partial [Gammaproteobacteria bacterium]